MMIHVVLQIAGKTGGCPGCEQSAQDAECQGEQRVDDQTHAHGADVIHVAQFDAVVYQVCHMVRDEHFHDHLQYHANWG